MLALLLAAFVDQAQYEDDHNEDGHAHNDGGEEGERMHRFAAHGQLWCRRCHLGRVGGLQIAIALILVLAADDILAVDLGYNRYLALKKETGLARVGDYIADWTYHEQTAILLGRHAAIGALLLVGAGGLIVDFLNGAEAAASWSRLAGAVALIVRATVVAVAGQCAGCK